MSSPRAIGRRTPSQTSLLPQTVRHTVLGTVAAIMTVAITGSPVVAACNDRPGTPNDLDARVLSPSVIELVWTHRTRVRNAVGTMISHRMWFDIRVTESSPPEAAPRGSKHSRTGWGPLNVPAGFTAPHQGSARFEGLQPNTKYCFAMRARTEGGMQGCISQLESSPACATTPPDSVTTPPSSASPATPPSQSGAPPVKVLGRFRQFATAKNDVDIYFGPGGNFPKAKVFMKKGREARVLGRHRDGWSKLELGVAGGDNWVADDHLTYSLRR